MLKLLAIVMLNVALIVLAVVSAIALYILIVALWASLILFGQVNGLKVLITVILSALTFVASQWLIEIIMQAITRISQPTKVYTIYGHSSYTIGNSKF